MRTPEPESWAGYEEGGRNPSGTAVYLNHRRACAHQGQRIFSGGRVTFLLSDLVPPDFHLEDDRYEAEVIPKGLGIVKVGKWAC